jgi:hypothetical protein
LILGLGAGILALSAWQGFVFYLVGYLAITGALLAKAGDLTGTRYWKGGFDVWSQEVFSGLLSFVLSWTLSYALVHGKFFAQTALTVVYD